MNYVQMYRDFDKERKRKENDIIDVLEEALELTSTPVMELEPNNKQKEEDLKEVAKLYKNQGWIEIFSGYLNAKIYLIKHSQVKIPNDSIPTYLESEVEALSSLTKDELSTLHDAKCIFQGVISNEK
jgi:hypothetical protein